MCSGALEGVEIPLAVAHPRPRLECHYESSGLSIVIGDILYDGTLGF